MSAILLLIAVGMPQKDWYVYAPEGKGYRVEMPGRPNHTTSRVVTSAAGRSEFATAKLETVEARYAIQVSENPGEVDPKTLDDGIKKFAESKRATLGAVKTISVDGNPGREFAMTEPEDEGESRSKVRWVAAGNVLFILSASGGPKAGVPDDADRFLGSLRIGAAKPIEAAPEKPARGADRDAAIAREPDAVDDGPDVAPQPRGKAASKRLAIRRVPEGAKRYADEDLVDLPRPYLAAGGDGFRDVGPEGSVLVGVRVTYVDKFGGPKIGSAQPIYRSGTDLYEGKRYGEAAGPVMTVVARPGYAVGGLMTHSGLMVDGFRMVFMKVEGDGLDPNDTYNSPWLGDEKGGGPGDVESKGRLVVGLHGRAGEEIRALGLTMRR